MGRRMDHGAIVRVPRIERNVLRLLDDSTRAWQPLIGSNETTNGRSKRSTSGMAGTTCEYRARLVRVPRHDAGCPLSAVKVCVGPGLLRNSAVVGCTGVVPARPGANRRYDPGVDGPSKDPESGGGVPA